MEHINEDKRYENESDFVTKLPNIQQSNEEENKFIKPGLRRGTSIRSQLSTSSKRGTNNTSKRFVLAEVVEYCFEMLVRDTNDKIPTRFYQFYNNPLFLSFLAACIHYFTLHQNRSIRSLVSQNPTYSTPEKAAALKAGQLRMAETYAKVVLFCSNYEHTKGDEMFFECLYQYTLMVLRHCIDPKPRLRDIFWNYVKQELFFFLRGPHFSKQAIHPSISLDGDQRTDNSRVLPRSRLPLHSSKVANASTASTAHALSDTTSRSHTLRKQYQRRRKFSIYSIVHARSPFISMLLPAPPGRANLAVQLATEKQMLKFYPIKPSQIDSDQLSRVDSVASSIQSVTK